MDGELKKKSFLRSLLKLHGEKLKNLSSYHAELVGIFLINHILRYITVINQDKKLPDISYIMFSRMYTKEMNWDHRRS